LCLLLCLSLLLPACVSQSRFLEKENEATRLGRTVQSLQADLTRQQEDNAALAGRNDELDRRLTESLARSAALQQDLVRARADLDRLETVLSARSAETGAALTEMRQTIDRLQEENRELARQIELERLAREARLAQVKSTYDELVEKMEAEITRGEVTISDLQGKLTVNMVERILFGTGQADIKPAGLEVLRRVGDILKEVEDKEIRIEGHTDNVPISSRLRQIFPSNWELSTARANNVVHFLQGEVRIAGERLSACGYGEFRPIASNDTPEGRAQNRRIQIVLVPF
ncbi:MAG: OmpA family protein, partial [Desulfuromonadales bacterium]|nr:OmpA family protein [Desulfuromonadales bacterium]